MNDSKENLIVGLRVPLARPWITDDESDAGHDVIRSGWLIFGPRVAEFEERFAALLGVRHAIAVNNGSSALLCTMWALGLGPGDEIIAPDVSFVSTASAALFLGAQVRFSDISLDTYCMDAADVERHITPRTKLLVPVHLAGHSADMQPLAEIAERHGLQILEDSAESHLARYQGATFTGTIGRAGIFSFTPSKPMTTGEGGMIVTNDDKVAERCRLFRNFGDTDKFQWDFLGFNFRMPEVMGAIGAIQLEKLPEAVRRRREIAHRYNAAFAPRPELVIPPERDPEDTNYQLYTLRLRRGATSWHRDELLAAMADRGVSARLYYPALHRAGVFAACGPFHDRDYPNTIEYVETALSLPIYPTLTGEEQDYVIECLCNLLDFAKS